LKPDAAAVHDILAMALDKQGDHDGALAEYREVVRLRPDEASAHFSLADALEAKGDRKGALAEKRKAAELGQKK
jgi:Flp pilus assembly protein TadD